MTDAPSDRSVTDELTRLGAGDALAAAQLIPLVDAELRRIASHHLSSERPGHTLQPTALVNEAYLRLIDQTRVRWNDRAHFMAIAAQTIRRILVDHARRHLAAKRGAGRGVSLELVADAGGEPAAPGRTFDVLALEEALERLASLSPRQAKVVDLRFFAGLEVREIAEALGVSERTVKGDWRFARAWLERELRGGDA